MDPLLSLSVQMAISFLALIGTLYTFHRKVIMSDIQATVLTKAEAKIMESNIEARYERSLGEKLEAEVAEIKEDIKVELRVIRTDIKELLKRA